MLREGGTEKGDKRVERHEGRLMGEDEMPEMGYICLHFDKV